MPNLLKSYLSGSNCGIKPAIALLCLILCATVGRAHAQSTTSLQQAKTYEAAADYENALVSYREYLQQAGAESAERRHARLKLSVLQEVTTQSVGPELELYLSALNLRADGRIADADAQLVHITDVYSGSTLADDAVYLRAYIALMDNYQFAHASNLLQSLQDLYPQSRYIDTALFANAITQEQLGNGDAALDYLHQLRDRHTGFSAAGISWAKDEYLSRFWYQRSDSRIEYLTNRADIVTQLLSMRPTDTVGYQWQAELIVNQQSMTLLLNESTTIKDATVVGSDIQVQAFSGIVMGQPDSWARLTIDDSTHTPALRGTISVYGERHTLVPSTTGGSLSDFHTLLLGDIDGNVANEHDHIVLPPDATGNIDTYLRSIRQVTSTELIPGEVGQVAQLGVVIDSKYNDYHGGRGVIEANSIINDVDGLFQEQLGIAIKITSIVLIDDRDNDPMNLGSVTMEKMMRNFKEYRENSDALGSDIGLATLFSGNKNSDSALGLAWIGSACRTDGFDVSVVTPYNSPALLSTHEIGHTMGAPHDIDTACSTQQQHIMWPFLSSSTGQTFSSCSRDAIARTIQNNNCHIEAIDLAVSLESINENSMTISISNLDQRRTAPDTTLTVTGPGLGNAQTSKECQKVDNDTLSCYTGVLSPLQSLDISFEFSANLSDSALVAATLHGNSFYDIHTANNSIQSDNKGALSKYTGTLLDSSPLFSSGNGAFTSSGASGQSSASLDGGGTWPLTGMITLVLLGVARRRYTPSAIANSN